LLKYVMIYRLSWYLILLLSFWNDLAKFLICYRLNMTQIKFGLCFRDKHSESFSNVYEAIS